MDDAQRPVEVTDRSSVLVIAGDPAAARVTPVLEEHFDVVVEPSVRVGVFEAARRVTFDLVVLCEDAQSEPLHSLDLLAEMTQLEGVPFLVVADTTADVTPWLIAGADDAVRSPLSADELVARAHNLVRAKRERAAMMEQLLASRDELHAVVGQVGDKENELAAALHETRLARSMAERAASMKSNLLRMMAHELRTPVATVQLQIALLERELDESQLEIAVRMKRSLTRLLELIESALEYARIESGRYQLTPQPFALQDVLRDVVSDQLPLAEHKGLDLAVQAEAMPPLSSDANLVRLVASNLLGNALKFTSVGGVVLRAWHLDGRHGFAVEDTGPGIPVERHAEVFEPFNRSDDVRYRSGTGSGLGLALVKEMVGALGGTIELSSGATGGSRFEVSLPTEPPTLAPGEEPG